MAEIYLMKQLIVIIFSSCVWILVISFVSADISSINPIKQPKKTYEDTRNFTVKNSTIVAYY
jgi:hypothetical protein